MIPDSRQLDLDLVQETPVGGTATTAPSSTLRGRNGVVPENAVYIGHSMPRLRLWPSKWANPFRIGPDGARDEVLAKYRAWLLQRPELIAALPELRGKILASWCAPKRYPARARRGATSGSCNNGIIGSRSGSF